MDEVEGSRSEEREPLRGAKTKGRSLVVQLELAEQRSGFGATHARLRWWGSGVWAAKRYRWGAGAAGRDAGRCLTMKLPRCGYVDLRCCG